MGGEQAASVLATVKQDQLARKGASMNEEEEAAFVAELPEATREAYGEVVEKASMAGLYATLRVMGIVSAICLVLAVLLPGGRPSQAESSS